MLFSELGLTEEVLQAVTESGYETPTPIQAKAIPLCLAGRDVIGASHWGGIADSSLGLVKSTCLSFGRFLFIAV